MFSEIKFVLIVIIFCVSLVLAFSRPHKVTPYDMASSNYLLMSRGNNKINIGYTATSNVVDLLKTEKMENAFYSFNRYYVLNKKEYIICMFDALQIRKTKDHSVVLEIPVKKSLSLYITPPDFHNNKIFYINEDEFYCFDLKTRSTSKVNIFNKIMKSKYFVIFKPKMTNNEEINKSMMNTYIENKSFTPDSKIGYQNKGPGVIFFSNRVNVFNWQIGSEFMQQVCTGNSPQVFSIGDKDYLYFLDNNVLKRGLLIGNKISNIEEVIKCGVVWDYKVMKENLLFFVIDDKPNFKGSKAKLLYVLDNGVIKPVVNTGGFLGMPIEVYDMSH